MFVKLATWFDHRTGCRKLVEVLLIEHIPGGAKWRYVWGSCLAFVFLVQLVTGLLLMTSYSAGESTAWSSVFFIQYEMDFGWLIRGLHHFGSQTMVVLLGLHMLQVVIAGAHLPPREVNWWLGLALLVVVLGLSLTGYLLPWDQKGYWATQVATNIAGNLPGAGSFVQKIVVGGPAYGHQTLTRFFTLHVAVLPPLVIVLVIAHLTVFRRHGVTAPKKAVGEGWFWPDQAFRDMVASLIIFGIMLGLVVYGHGHKIEPAEPASAADAAPSLYERIAHAGRDGRGANLDAPADSARPYPARPEWYFLFLFQLLKYFEGEQEIIGTVVIPNGVLLLLFLLPLLGYGRMRPFGHAFGILVVVALLGGAATLTYLALAADRLPNLSDEQIATLSGPQRQQVEKAKLFHRELEQAEASAGRVIQLADQGIPPEGAVYLLRRDPLTKGKELFAQHCGVCHTHGTDCDNPKPTASDLKDFGSAEWVRGLLRDPAGSHYLGATGFKGMANFVKRARRTAEKEKKVAELEAEWDRVAAWLGSHPRRDPPKEGEAADGPFAQGYRAFERAGCAECHTYKDTGGGSTKAPDLTGYGDADWLRQMLVAPASDLRYGSRNRMPAFRDLEGVAADVHRNEMRQTKEILLKGKGEGEPDAEAKKEVEAATRVVSLSDVDRELIIRWLLKDYRVVFGGDPISGPPRR